MLFLSQRDWQGHLAGEQAVPLNSCGHNWKKLCVGYIKALSSHFGESGSCCGVAPVCIGVSIRPSGFLSFGIGKWILFGVSLLLCIFVKQAEMQ